MARTTQRSTANSLQEKLRAWCYSFYFFLFRRTIGGGKGRYADQEVELIRGRGRRGSGGVEGGGGGKTGEETCSETSQYSDYLNYGEEDEMEIEGYARSRPKTTITWFFIIITLGLLRLIFHWWPRLMVYATHKRVPLAAAEKVLIIEQYQQKYKRYHAKNVFTVSSQLFRTRLDAAESQLPSDIESTTHSSSLRMVDEDESLDKDGTTMGDMVVDQKVSKPAGGGRGWWWRNAFSDFFLGRCHGFLSSVKQSSSRTNQIFLAAGLPQDQINETTKAWDQKLEQELLNIEFPQLAIPKGDGSIRETQAVRLFTCKKLRYLWDEQYGAFCKLPGFDCANTHQLHESSGLSIFQQCQRRLIYGNNEIKVEVKSIVKLLFLEVLNPFYVFQIFSVSLWLSDNYIYFSIAIIVMSVFGITSTIIQTRKNQQKLRTTVQSSDIVMVSRGGDVYEPIPTEYLVPGDVIVINNGPHGCTMHCDAALLSGNCIVNESMLTGESVPVTKIPLPNRPDIAYNVKEHARHTLFSGTTVMQTRYYGSERVLAVVLRCGFLTAKGSLVRSILYPPPVDYKFERDSYKFVAVLACIAGVGFINSIFTKLRHGETVRNIIVDSLDLITIVVPPALPAAMTVGRLYAQRRLQKKGIYCISPRAINVSGSIDCVCFDKTGTLTEEGLDLWGAVPSSCETRKLDDETSEDFATFQTPVREVSKLAPGPLFIGMAACHSLTLIDGTLIGDPLDLKMFEWTEWSLEEPGVADNEKFDKIAPTIVRPKQREVNDNLNIAGDTEVGISHGIIRQFPFSSSLQRMSVITRTLGASEFELYCKGSPEMITSLSRRETVPKNFNLVLEAYTQEGFRVIAIGYKKLGLNYAKAQRVVREEVETDLIFLGLIVLDNRLKPASSTEMATLKKAGIRTIMVTGDNMLTALSVARDCGMVEQNAKVIVINVEMDKKDKNRKPAISFSIVNKQIVSGSQSPVSMESGASCSTIEQNLINMEAALNRYHFAVSGSAFAAIKLHYPDLLSKVLVRGTVFARMSPDQKQQLVEHLQAIQYFVGMCGDGANDVGALKAAHAGISLSEAESSVASPFTSTESNIKCVPHIIREGRAALVTSFGIFKYMAVYSLTQFVSVIILYTIQSNLGDLQFLYIDLFLISIFALFFGHTEPYDGPLEKQPPSASLVSAAPIISILCHMASIVGIQSFAFAFVQYQSWFSPYVHKEDEYASYENYTLFSVSTFQYIIMAIVFSRGKPYRKSLLTNHRLLAALIILTSFTAYLVLSPCSWLVKNLELQLPPSYEFRFTLLVFALVNLITAIIIEHGVVNYFVAKKFGVDRTNGKKEHARIERELAAAGSEWPPLSDAFGVGDKLNPESGVTKGLHYGNNARIESDVEKYRRHSITLTIPVPKMDQCSRPRSHNSYVITPASEPGGGFHNNHHDQNDFKVAVDILNHNNGSLS
ncbi:probable cation-transporting ATPase 13A3 isoform X2 [Folsomia candida]|uniref:probable cation-transporting ATPase 13A3 isoform X2 n=1 Tax=Folsomia candida TaxID=158441 RepID=UPI000B908520|nr:probable cation-transporting ATPase 13A3 isoform X2 [Folsomia candida]